MKYDVVATVGTYEKDGQTKYLTRNVGRLMETKSGLRLKLDASFNPAGCPRNDDGSIWLALFEPKDDKDAPKSTYSKPKQLSNDAPFDDSVPF